MNLFVRKEAFDRLSGFNERLETCEDVDLCFRLKKQGRIVSDDRIRVFHRGEAADIRHFFRKERWRGLGNTAGVASHGISLKEMPTLMLPAYFGLFLPAAATVALLFWKWSGLALMLILFTAPSAAALFKVRKKIHTPIDGILLAVLLQVYFAARTAAFFDTILGPKKSRGAAGPKTIPCPDAIHSIRGVLFDVDGTLYHQTPLRILMTMRIIIGHVGCMRKLPQTVRIIRAYRRAQEKLRKRRPFDEQPLQRQIDNAARICGEHRKTAKRTVETWMERKPLRFLPLVKRAKASEAIRNLKQRGLKIGALSDYPAADKLDRLGLLPLFDVVLSAADDGIRGFKPSTNGFQVAAEKLGLPPEQVLYIGDRSDVDAEGASRAGMPFLLVKGLLPQKRHGNICYLHHFSDLPRLIPGEDMRVGKLQTESSNLKARIPDA
jgi:phosphoglycolate phosphatase/putative hydrolase of the HAD superfamily